MQLIGRNRDLYDGQVIALIDPGAATDPGTVDGAATSVVVVAGGLAVAR